MNTKGYIPPSEAADRIGCSTAYIRILRARGKLAGKLVGHVNWLRERDVERYRRERKGRDEAGR